MSQLANTFRVAIFDEFLDAFARIPRAQQKKVNKFLRKFRANPTDPGINYEKISTFKDQNLRTVRIDQAYRGIVLKPQEGNLYVLLWVDHHDEAMAWAKNKRVTIHPETGALQVLTGDHVELGIPEVPAANQEVPLLFAAIRDRELLRLGVPEELLSVVRAVQTMEQLDELQRALPAEAYEALFFLGEGDSLEDVERAMAITPVENVDTSDFEAALERDASKRRFVVVDEDAALEAMLDAPLEKWRIFLHPSQRKLVYRSWNGPVRVLGGAGTGKTVVAMHRAAYLAERVFREPEDRVLFTTFTRNLAADIEANLKKLCGPDVFRRISVVHIDKWVSDLLKRAGYEYQVAYWQAGTKLEGLWNQAMAMAPPDLFQDVFYRDEWELVVQYHGCETWEDYKKASRAGRGTRMSRKQRRAVWPVFEEYRHLLDREHLREPEDALRDATALLAQGALRAQYRAIVVDEAQDMSTNAFRLLRQAMGEQRPDDLFIVGDGHQRIYRRKVVLGRAGVNVRGRGRRLRINYRTTDEIRRFAVALLKGVEVDDLDDGLDTTKGYKSLMHGSPPRLDALPSFEAEVDRIATFVAEGTAETTCLVARSKALRDKHAEALNARGIETYAVRRSAAENYEATGLRVATMHRVKGLEYERMILAGMSDSVIPWWKRIDRTQDVNERDERIKQERALLYVATTRAKRDVLITAHGKMTDWVG